MIRAPTLSGQSYAIFGLARSGLATARALIASGCKVAVWDDQEAARTACDFAPLCDLYQADLADFSALILSPGVPLGTHPLAARARAAHLPIIGDIEIFARARADLPPHKVIGVTGTNGKSTTCALIHHIIAQSGRPTLLGGNIGAPILGEDPLPAHGVYVLELSSFQLDLTQSLACDVAVLLNITPDHLDRHGDFQSYIAAKKRLFSMQDGYGHAFVSQESVPSRDIGASLPHASLFSADDARRFGTQQDWPALHGPHNAENIAAAALACRAVGIDDDDIRAGLQTYPGLAHRMEHVATLDGVSYINDSKATNGYSTARALASWPRGIYWIVGGRAKGDDIQACRPYAAHIARAYLIGEAAERFAPILRDWGIDIVQAHTLDVAVDAAAKAAHAGDIVLLSPACASQDQFRDFEERGQVFKAKVAELAA